LVRIKLARPHRPPKAVRVRSQRNRFLSHPIASLRTS
jgi:hypothetical protein